MIFINWLKNTIIVTIIALFILVTSINNFPTSVSESYAGLIYSSSTKNIEEHITITLNGTLERNLFIEGQFTGLLTVGNDLSYIVNMTKDKHFWGYIQHQEKDELIRIGRVYTTEDFKLIYINLDEINEKYNSQCNIVGPASNRKEGLIVMLKVLEPWYGYEFR